MPFKNTPEVDGAAARPRVKTDARGGDIEPDGSPSGPTDAPRGQYPKSNGGPPEPEAAQVGGADSGDHLIPDVPANAQIPPVATRATERESTGTNPLT